MPMTAAGATTISDPLDPRLVFMPTPQGAAEAAVRQIRLSQPARRVLLLVDGRRPTAQLALVVRAGELPAAIRELENAGLITVAALLDELPPELAAGTHRELAELKERLRGAFERELGPAAAVLEARVQDCVNLVVLRAVLRELIDQVEHRGGRPAAERILGIVRSVGGPAPYAL